MHHAFIQYMQMTIALYRLHLVDHHDIQKSQVAELLVFHSEIQMYGRLTYKILQPAGDGSFENLQQLNRLSTVYSSLMLLEFDQDTRRSKWNIPLYFAANLATGGFILFES